MDGLSISGGLVALPCASAKHSRLLPEVFDDCSSVCRRLSLRERAIIRDLSEIVFALDLLETGSIVGSVSCEKVVFSILFTDLASPALRRLHFVISDFGPPRVTESGEAALRRLLSSRAIGRYSLTSDDPAPGSLSVCQSSRAARLQDASKAFYLGSLLSGSVRSCLDAFSQRLRRPVPEVADMEIRLGPVITLIHFSS